MLEICCQRLYTCSALKTSCLIPFIPDAHTLLMVVQTTVFGIPAPNAACLAGACPKLALKTLPKKTSCTRAGATFALLRAPEHIRWSIQEAQFVTTIKKKCRRNTKGNVVLQSIAIDPSLVADKDDRAPRKPPIGVRATPTTHTSVQNKMREKHKNKH